METYTVYQTTAMRLNRPGLRAHEDHRNIEILCRIEKDEPILEEAVDKIKTHYIFSITNNTQIFKISTVN